MDWFRFYHSVLNDPKVQNLDGETFKRWINLLCLASLQPGQARGTLPALADTALALRLSEQEARELLRALRRRKLLDRRDDGQLAPHNWGKRQGGRPSDAPEEVRKRVQRHRAQRVTTLPSNGGNAAVTRYSRDSRALPHSPLSPPTPPAISPQEQEQEREGERGESVTATGPATGAARPGTHPAIALYCQVRQTSLSAAQAQLIAEHVQDTPEELARWGKAVTACESNGISRANVKCALDWLRKGIPERYRLPEKPMLPEKPVQNGQITPAEEAQPAAPMCAKCAARADRAREAARRLVRERLRTAKGPLTVTLRTTTNTLAASRGAA